MEHLAKTTRSPTTLAGFSLGGNITLKLAGEDRSASTAGIDSFVAVSAPIDLDKCVRLIEQPSNRIYQMYFARQLRADATQRQRFFPDLPPLHLPARTSIRTFDECYTAPRSGFLDANDYYAKASSAPLVPKISLPTLMLTARDDPFISVLPYEQIPKRSHLELLITERGGHLGFLGPTGKPSIFRWMDELIIEWIIRRSENEQIY